MNAAAFPPGDEGPSSDPVRANSVADMVGKMRWVSRRVAGLGLLFAQLQGQMLFGRDRLPGRVATRVVISQVSQPSNTARARAASPRSREPASAVSAARSSLVAESGDRPVVLGTCESMPQGNQPAKRWSSRQILLRKMARGPLPN